MVWVIGLLVVIVVAALAALVLRRRSTTVVATPDVSAAPVPDEAPMTGLEAALAKATGSDGRPIAEHIDAETQHVDELRVPDDTGPLLRRALDHVEQHGPADEPAAGSDGDTATDDPD